MPKPPPDTAPAIKQDLHDQGASYPLRWDTPGNARALAARLLTEHTDEQEIVKNPHRAASWARRAAHGLLGAVQAVIGPDVAIENTFLVIKRPGRVFEVPWHQDGIDHRIELDPARSVAAWLALTDATTENGCLHITPGSHRLGYLPYDLEEASTPGRGRAGRAAGFTCRDPIPVPLAAGDGVLMDVRLVHRSGPNTTPGARLGLNIRYVAPGAARAKGRATLQLDPLSGSDW